MIVAACAIRQSRPQRRGLFAAGAGLAISGARPFDR